jgi:predicted amidophosphoribosyltransferase
LLRPPFGISMTTSISTAPSYHAGRLRAAGPAPCARLWVARPAPQPCRSGGRIRKVATTMAVDPAPLGFPACGRCIWNRRDDPAVCLACAVEPAPRTTQRCPVCEQAVRRGEACANHWCGRADRHFSQIWSLSRHAGPLRWAIGRYKYRGERGWADVFARLLLGYLDDRMPWFDHYDLLVPMPAYTGSGARRAWDHLGLVGAGLVRLGGWRWPVATGVVVKTAETPAVAGMSLARRRACAEGPLRRALAVPDAEVARGARVLVLDDVFTEGSTLREVARALVRAGALEVAGLVLARQGWPASAGRAPQPPESSRRAGAPEPRRPSP